MCKSKWIRLTCLALALSGTTGFGLEVVKKGKPAATIVVAADAGDKVRTAATDLQGYIEKMSGARLPLVTDGETTKGPVILVGRSRLTEAAGVKIPSGWTHARREEGFIIDSDGDRLVLAGNDEGLYHGTEYAVYDFLERLGVRWFMPGEYGEVVPTTTSIRFDDIEVRETPDFVMRLWTAHMPAEIREQEARWKLRNKMGIAYDLFQAPSDGTVDQVVDKSLFEEHPEYFAMNQDGTRNVDMPSLSHPGAVKVAAEIIKKKFRDNPQTNSYGFALGDARSVDFDPETMKFHIGFTDVVGREGIPTEESVSEEWFRFVNRVTVKVREEFPDHYIATNGYFNRNTPPEDLELNDHMVIMFAAIWSDTYHAYDNPRSWQTIRQGQMLKEFASRSKNVWVYDYNYTNLVTALTPVPRVRKVARDIPLMKEWGVMGFLAETRNVWAECGITTRYVRSKLEWNASADVDALLDDYFEKWYGKAARPARAYWDALEEAMEETPMLGHEDRFMPSIYTPALINKLEKAVTEAERKADTARTKVHVKADRLILAHLKRYLDMRAAEFNADFAAAAAQAQRMFDVRKELSAINIFYCLPDEETIESGVYYWGLTQRQEYYESLAKKISGETGDLVALLPTETKFRIDPRDEGRFSGWSDADADDGDWKTLLTTKPFYAQGYMDEVGYPYMGYIWYRFKVDVPAAFAGRKIMLYAAILETEGWGWVNGKYVGHRPYSEAYIRPAQMEFDVTDAVVPGQANVVAIRVGTGRNAAQAAGGFMSRLFMYAPKGEE
jgi:hypothetical protein